MTSDTGHNATDHELHEEEFKPVVSAVSAFASEKKQASVIIELGCGDGRLLQSLASADPISLYIGIEIKKNLCQLANQKVSSLNNVIIVNGSFDVFVPMLPDNSVDKFVSVLPDPAYIDKQKERSWKGFYLNVLSKLKPGGNLEIVTELTDDLFQPVKEEDFQSWIHWLISRFLSMGFRVDSNAYGHPRNLASQLLEQFGGDQERIRIATLVLSRPMDT